MEIKKKLLAFLKNESGATAIEYTIMATVMGLALIPAIKYYADSTQTVYNTIGSFMAK